MTAPTRPPATFSDDEKRRLRQIDAWVFDLDNTLYPPHSDLFSQVDRRIHDYVARMLDIDRDRARELQKDYYRRYGTTLRGLMQEHDIEPDGFLEYVHDIDHSVVAPDPHLAVAIQRLPGRRYIFTNGSRAHAEKVAERLGITDHFEDIFDIVRAGLLPKPAKETYDLFLAETQANPATSIMFEDLARNLTVPRMLGMATVLVVPTGTRPVFTEDWELEGHDADHVDHVTDNLAAFLTKIMDEIGIV